jgi:uncharacterized protein (TIGR02266 family)
MRMSGRRSEARAEADFEVQYGSAQGLVAAAARNISRGGMYVQTPQPLDLNQEALLRFTVPGTSRRVEVHGTVAWVNFPSARNPVPAGMGIKFRDLPLEARIQIGAFVKNAQAPASPAG